MSTPRTAICVLLSLGFALGTAFPVGIDCVSIPENVCNGHGTPNPSFGCNCSCVTGWAGPDCATPTENVCFFVREPCNGRGEPDPLNDCQCRCYVGWTGAECSTCVGSAAVDCGPVSCATPPGVIPCSGRGTLSAPDCRECICDAGYTSGSNCAECAPGYLKNSAGECTAATDGCMSIPEGVCNGHGAPDARFGCECSCESGWAGAACSVPTSVTCWLGSETCNFHGEPDPLNECACRCYQSWAGPTCALPACPATITCSGNGHADPANACQCRCYEGFAGRDCSTRVHRRTFTTIHALVIVACVAAMGLVAAGVVLWRWKHKIAILKSSVHAVHPKSVDSHDPTEGVVIDKLGDVQMA